MKIIIVRHGEPNYEIDGLTDRGVIEAELVSERLIKEKVSKIYCSPLGRARLTAMPTLKKLGMNAEILDWLQEFDSPVKLPYLDSPNCPWDLLPEYVEECDGIYSPTRWLDVPHIKNSDVPEKYKWVTSELDALLARHGYERDGFGYKVTASNHDTIILFCHFGLTCVLLSHLMNSSPYSLWQHLCTAPTGVTVINTEERREGIAHFRAAAIGDISHLYTNGVEPSFAARFCECYSDDTRHD
jgi:probable phosphoglycerate mutase